MIEGNRGPGGAEIGDYKDTEEQRIDGGQRRGDRDREVETRERKRRGGRGRKKRLVGGG